MSSYLPWKSFERYLKQFFVRCGFDADRVWSRQFEEKSGVDVVFTDSQYRVLVQAKYGKAPNLKKALKEAEGEITNKNDRAVAIGRWKGTKDTLVLMRLSYYGELLKREK